MMATIDSIDFVMWWSAWWSAVIGIYLPDKRVNRVIQ